MIDFVYNHDAEVAHFVGQLSPPAGGGFGRCKTIGMIDGEGKLIAGLVYFNYDPEAEAIEFGAAAITPRWFTQSNLPPDVRISVCRVRLPDAVWPRTRGERAPAQPARQS